VVAVFAASVTKTVSLGGIFLDPHDAPRSAPNLDRPRDRLTANTANERSARK
jgi:hypothetical protein